MKVKLYRENGDEAGLYDVCEYLLTHYPEDIFVSSDHPVHRMRDLAREVIQIRERAKELLCMKGE